MRKAFPKPSWPLHKWYLREPGEVGDIHLSETAPLEVSDKVVSLLSKDQCV